ncbi:MAG: DUF4442 domain-containing protein [Ginsengibacter sp.]
MNSSQKQFLKLANNPFKFGMFLLYKLPAAFFSGVRVRKIDEGKCITSVPFTWLTQNPFRSTYFASLAMAAEMSTGLLAMSNTYKRFPSTSMLLTTMEAAYFKKATGTTFFTCEEGVKISQTVDVAYVTKKGEAIKVKTTGKNNNGELVAEFLFTWSFKVKK